MATMFDNSFSEEFKKDYMTSAIDGFNFSVENFGIEVKINSKATKVLLKNKVSGHEKEISAKLEEINVGDLVEIGTQKWLIVDLPVENEIYSKASLRRCNTTFVIKDKIQRVMTGRDDDDRPIFTEIAETINEPCIATNTYSTGNENEQLPLPDGNIDVIMRYRNADSLVINKNFVLYNQTYEIYNIDYTKVIDGNGIMIVRGKREVSRK